jgi:hypothetical protein
MTFQLSCNRDNIEHCALSTSAFLNSYRLETKKKQLNVNYRFKALSPLHVPHFLMVTTQIFRHKSTNLCASGFQIKQELSLRVPVIDNGHIS